MMKQEEKVLKAGTVLIPKPEWFDFYRDKMNNWTEYLVTDHDEANNATIGERWMIKPLDK